MENLEDTQDFNQKDLPDVVPLDAGIIFSNDEGNESVSEGGYKSKND